VLINTTYTFQAGRFIFGFPAITADNPLPPRIWRSSTYRRLPSDQRPNCGYGTVITAPAHDLAVRDPRHPHHQSAQLTIRPQERPRADFTFKVPDEASPPTAPGYRCHHPDLYAHVGIGPAPCPRWPDHTVPRSGGCCFTPFRRPTSRSPILRAASPDSLRAVKITTLPSPRQLTNNGANCVTSGLSSRLPTQCGNFKFLVHPNRQRQQLCQASRSKSRHRHDRSWRIDLVRPRTQTSTSCRSTTLPGRQYTRHHSEEAASRSPPTDFGFSDPLDSPSPSCR